MGITHLQIHTGKTKQIRAQTAIPTVPSPVPGDVFFDISAGVEALGFRNESGWEYVSARPA